ncbi:membrane-bound alkaline phosphatase-like [Culicoides brevitarsis]|uniref:membrane-bound alkaline phosphatase-like n=1 Tax=Culicoides brevitarsis TaxID=469753 RepID=UPI00307C9E80
MTTTTATRSFESDPNQSLAYEKLPFTGMSKTYCVDRQVADSACTATAYLCGVKANYQTIGVNAKVFYKECDAQVVKKNRTPSIAEWAIKAGKGAGIVTNMRVTHASPAGVYANTANRNWENDAEVEKSGCDASLVDDIAEQLVRNAPGNALRVIMGGGRRNFRSKNHIDEEGDEGKRNDDVDLVSEWLESKKNQGKYVWNREELLKVDTKNVSYLLGLFESSHMFYNLEVLEEGRDEFEPTLAEMVEKAIDVLTSEPNGYFLFVEGGLIDHGHHSNRAKQSLDETREFSKAIELAMSKIDLDETLVVVTSDHSHSFSYGGYPERDANILRTTGEEAEDGMESMFLSYANGKGYKKHVKEEGGRVDPKTLKKPSDFRHPATLPKDSETHGGDDVGVYAAGPWAHLFTGNFEEHTIPHMMAFAACIGDGIKACDEK